MFDGSGDTTGLDDGSGDTSALDTSALDDPSLNGFGWHWPDWGMGYR
jgi:hypothetical protein